MNNRKEDMEITSHYRQLLRELNEQRQHGILCDVCVIVEGKIFKAHKNVLLGSSRYFKTLYCQVKKGSEQQATITHLDIVTAQGFKTILDFMYSAHLALTSKNVIEVMSAASYLQMTDIVQACHGFIKAALDISIRSELADELADIEMGSVVTSIGGTGPGVGGASEALASMISARSSSPWLVRRTSPANSSGDSAIASCHEGSSNYGKEDQDPKSHESQEDACLQPLWTSDYRSVQVKEEQVSPSNMPDGASRATRGSPGDQSASGDGGWQHPGSGRRKNRKNKDTVRHITQQNEGDSRPVSPLPSMLSNPGWNYSNQDIPGAEAVEAEACEGGGVKQEEGVAGEEPLTPERGGSVANLRAALMSKNSLLSLGAEMLGEDNPLLFDYLPKGGGHSLSRPRGSNGSTGSHNPGASFGLKHTASSSSPPSPLLLPSPGAFALPQTGGDPDPCPAERALTDSPTEADMQEEESAPRGGTELELLQGPAEEDQMVEEKRGACVAEVRGTGRAWRQELACSLCKQLFSSLLQLRQHEYGHTLSLMALSLDCLDHHRPLVATSPLNPAPARHLCSQCPASFTLKSNADRHEKTIHLKRKLMQCVYCLKHFRDRTDLNRHLSSVHSSQRVYTCPACSRTFSTQKNLATHVKVCCQAERLWSLRQLKEEPEDLRRIHADD